MQDEERVESPVAMLLVELPREGEAQEASPQETPAIEEVPLFDGRALSIGRAKTNDIQVNDPRVSRFHAVFSGSTGGVVLSDLSSRNGTLVNGRRISAPVDLASGDVVEVGGAKIRVRLLLADSWNTGAASDIETQSFQMSTTTVTVMIADVCGYTQLSERLPAQEVASMLDRWCCEVSKTVRAHGGEVDKYIGDCVMAFWRSTGENSSENAGQAAAAALAVLDRTVAISSADEWSFGDDFPWRCRVVLNTGDALSGVIGGGESRDFTILGDTVNVAFRLEGLAAKLGETLVVGKETARYISDRYSLKPLGAFAVEGRNEPVEIFAVTGACDQGRS